MPSEASRLRALPKKKAAFIEPMECARATKLRDGEQWLYEVKLDQLSDSLLSGLGLELRIDGREAFDGDCAGMQVRLTLQSERAGPR